MEKIKNLTIDVFFRLYIGVNRYKRVIITLFITISLLWGLYVYMVYYHFGFVKSLTYTLGLFAVDAKSPTEINDAFIDTGYTAEMVRDAKEWIAVYWVSLFAKFTLLLTVLLIYIRGVLSNIYRAWIKNRGGHTVVVGLGRNSRFFIESMLEKFPHRVMVFETDKENPYLYRYKNKKLSIILKDVEKIIDKLNLENAENVFISTGSDRKNIYYALHFLKQLQGNRNFGKLLVHIEDRTLRNLYSDKGTLDSHGIDMNVFSFYKESARMLFWKDALDGNDNSIIDGSEAFAINIIGEDDLSVSLVVEAFKLAHYPNGNHLHINVIAKEISPIKDKIEFAFPEMNQIKHIHLNYIELDDKTIDFYNPRAEIWNAINLKHILFSYDDITRNLSVATKVLNYTYLRRKEEVKDIKFHIATLNHKKIAKRIELSTEKNLSVFAKAEDVCSYKNLLDNDIDSMAKMIHYDYSIEESCNKSELESEDDEWNKALINDKKSSIGQAIHIPLKLKYLGLIAEKDSRNLSVQRLIELNIEAIDKSLKNRSLDALIYSEHNRWMALLRLMDYQYSDISQKDKSQRLHPLLKPLCEFSSEEQESYMVYNRNAIFKIATYQARLGNFLKVNSVNL